MVTNNQQEYEKDFYVWTVHNTKLLREGRLSEIDTEHVAEEIESLGREERRGLFNQLATLLANLLKWQYQPVKRSKGWMLAIKLQRMELNDLLKENPSLKKELKEEFNHIYEKAVLNAIEHTGFDEKKFLSPKPIPSQRLP